jgi:hypothetical protein
MGPIDPIRSVRLIRRERPKGEDEPQDEAATVVNLTVNVSPTPAETPQAPYQPPTNLDAHLIAQNARVRGLRGGQQVLDAARSSYLGNEYSGANDRRPRTGRITRTDV